MTEQLAEDRLRYAELFELAPDGYLVIDADALIVEANRVAVIIEATRRSIGWPPTWTRHL